MGLIARLDAVVKGRYHCHYRESDHGHPVLSLVTMLAELPRNTNGTWIEWKLAFVGKVL